MSYEDEFLLALLITTLLEGSIAPIVVLLLGITNVKWVHLIGVILLGSALTLPYLWFIVPSFVDARYYIEYGEAFVILVEALLYCWLLSIQCTKAFVLAGSVNLFSYKVGVLLFGALSLYEW
jgi:hypothetical protein